MSRRIPGVIMIDHVNRRLTVDGVELLPAHYIEANPSVEVIGEGVMAQVNIGIFTKNVLIRTEHGTRSPTAEQEAKRIVHEGMADILTWLGETP